MKHQYQSFTRIGRQFQSLKCQVYAVWTSVSFPLCQRSCLIWRIMTNTTTKTYVVIFLLASFFGRSYHSRYRISSSLGLDIAGSSSIQKFNNNNLGQQLTSCYSSVANTLILRPFLITLFEAEPQYRE